MIAVLTLNNGWMIQYGIELGNPANFRYFNVWKVDDDDQEEKNNKQT